MPEIFVYMKEKAIFNWSTGKDSALCLYKVLKAEKHEVMCLLTSVNELYQRVSMHGVRTELLESQAKSIGLPLQKVLIPEMPSMEVYEKKMDQVLSEWLERGAEKSIFGDIFLEDLRTYREEKLASAKLKGLFPLWKTPTDKLIREFIDLGFKAITTCVNDAFLSRDFVGRIIDEDFLNDLPENVDPCGENGEYHSFVFDGPIFSQPIAFQCGEIVYRKYDPSPSPRNDDSTAVCSSDDPFNNGFWYCDLLPLTN